MADDISTLPASTGDRANTRDSDTGNAVTCSSCGEAGLVETRIATAFHSGDHWAVIKDIPAIVCRVCREEFIDDTTAVRLDRMRADGFADQEPSETMTVPVYPFRSDSSTRS